MRLSTSPGGAHSGWAQLFRPWELGVPLVHDVSWECALGIPGQTACGCRKVTGLHTREPGLLPDSQLLRLQDPARVLPPSPFACPVSSARNAPSP